MDFWSSYQKRALEPEFGTRQLLLNTGDRYNTSLAKYVQKSSELKPGEAVFKGWDPKSRYLIAKNIDFDIFVSFYDVNSKGIVAMRLSMPIEKKDLKDLKRLVRRMKNANLEMRVIGLQNGDALLAPSIKQIRGLADCALVEVDLFGNQTRHLIIDLLTGKPFSLLLENRIYRPGELITASKKEDFDKTRSGLRFG
jgi:hypothetical protein